MGGAFSGIPEADVEVPAPVLREAAGRAVRAVWLNEVDGLTFQVGAGAGREFIKWLPGHDGSEFAAEARRLEWARAYTPVPRALGYGVERHGAWLRTAGLAGESAVSPRWVADPRSAVTAIGRGLRALHDALPVRDCPFSWSVASRLAAAPTAGRVTPAQARAMLDRAPPVDTLVVCHGDPCAPNTLIDDAGQWSGHVDLGALGVADRWADLAVATWSTQWNYGPGWEDTLLDAYGIAPDPDRIAYYRQVWDVT
ncbi:aminoglycoside 3'-phosphotransferase [Spiractinospora alimapuensis]|uniref:aminoglycoside 3'-phosphotransferase n=1 Tax=Spiractinospora alimapuensis TaxID=2820884 RepID=UPI001F47F781|nr:aminoglycoside 3'-phosphotransferase [Spiractinospora alimapuensis]QVQ52839.1 aminoglycoside 3'-phosphotransferase [Spiractinospora alimapuensis]